MGKTGPYGRSAEPGKLPFHPSARNTVLNELKKKAREGRLHIQYKERQPQQGVGTENIVAEKRIQGLTPPGGAEITGTTATGIPARYGGRTEL